MNGRSVDLPWTSDWSPRLLLPHICTSFSLADPVCCTQNFVAQGEFCIRACKDGPAAAALCQHIYDLMGCRWNMPGNYNAGFDTCNGESGKVRHFVVVVAASSSSLPLPR